MAGPPWNCWSVMRRDERGDLLWSGELPTAAPIPPSTGEILAQIIFDHH